LVSILIDWVAASLALLASFFFIALVSGFPFFCLYVIGAEFVGIARLLFFLGGPTRVYPGSIDLRYRLAAFAFLASYELFFKRLFLAFYKRGSTVCFSGCINPGCGVAYTSLISWSFIFRLP